MHVSTRRLLIMGDDDPPGAYLATRSTVGWQEYRAITSSINLCLFGGRGMLLLGSGSMSSVGRVCLGSTDSPVLPLAAALVCRMISGTSSTVVDMVRICCGCGNGVRLREGPGDGVVLLAVMVVYAAGEEEH